MSEEQIGKVDSVKWSAYVDRLEVFLVDQDYKPDLKISSLISVIGAEAYDLLQTFANPKKLSDLNYEEVVEIMRWHLQSPSLLEERYRFLQRIQIIHEYMSKYEFMDKIKRFARSYDFENSPSENRRDQLVNRIRSIIRENILAEPAATFDAVMDIAIALGDSQRLEAARQLQPGDIAAGSALEPEGSGWGQGSAARDSAGRQPYTVAEESEEENADDDVPDLSINN